MVNRIGDLELDQDLSYQQREWKIERTAWAVWALILLAALIGFLGSGVASHRTAGDEGSALWAEYNRFIRHGAPTNMLLHIDPALARDGVVNLHFDQQYLEKVKMESIVPRPEQEQALGDRIIYSFAVAETTQPLLIAFQLTPDNIGPLSTDVAIEGAAAVTIDHFVYP